MALGLSISLDNIPGISSALAKLDALKNDYLAVPARVTKAINTLTAVRQAMARSGAAQSAQSAALQLDQHLAQIRSEWQASADAWASVDRMRQTGALSLDLVTTAVRLATSATYVLTNMRSIESSVDTLASRYLTPEQKAAAFAAGGGIGGGGAALLLLLGGAILLGRSHGRRAPR